MGYLTARAVTKDGINGSAWMMAAGLYVAFYMAVICLGLLILAAALAYCIAYQVSVWVKRPMPAPQ